VSRPGTPGPVEGTGPVEFGVGERFRSGTFPTSWGWPSGTPYSEERTNWIISHIRASGGAGPHAQLAEKATRLRALLRVAEL
jgi:hypothetical protein